MGRRNSGGSGLRVRVGQDGGRRPHFHSEHDDRTDYVPRGGYRGRGGPVVRGSMSWRRGDKKQVSFKDRGTGGVKKRLGPRTGQQGPANLRNLVIDEGDESMGGNNRLQAGRARPAIRGAFTKRGRSSRGRGAYINTSEYIRHSPSGAPPEKSWYKIQLTNAGRYTKEEVMPVLNSACTVPFIPICLMKSGPHWVFHVENSTMANALKEVGTSRNVSLADGFVLLIHTSVSPPPKAPVNDDLIEVIKAVMNKRYKEQTKALDLSHFHADPTFVGEPVYACLNRSAVFRKVVSVISDHKVDLAALELSDNRLAVLDCLAELAGVTPNVTVLHLSNNSIRHVEDLKQCKVWKLQALKLNGNPLANHFKDDVASYQSAVRKIFPTLVTLDDQPLPKLITFDEGEETSALPPPQDKMFTGDQQRAEVAANFLAEFLTIYDSDNRQPLLDAYHEEASMSMHVAWQGKNSALPQYVSESRNLLRLVGPAARHHRLRRGRLAIVSLFQNLPATQHDRSSMTIDVHLAEPTLVVMTITGVFKERVKGQQPSSASSQDSPLQHFNRMFMLVPGGQGWHIVNEMLFITNATPLQAKRAFQGGAPTLPVVQAAAEPAPNDQRVMIQQLAQKTNMNEKYTRMCLTEAGWNLENAYAKFTQAQQAGNIPVHAFENM